MDRDELDRAYRATTFWAFVRGRSVPIRVGEHREELDRLTEQRSWAFITAWNPASHLPGDPAENETASHALREALEKGGHDWFFAVGIPDGDAYPEPGLLAMVDRTRAESLGRRFGQNAIVVGGPNVPPELIWLRS